MITFSAEPRTILIIKPSAIGDVVHTLPMLTMVRMRFPKAHIAWMVTPLCSGLLIDHPLLDEVILFDRKQLTVSVGNPRALTAIVRFCRDLRRRNFDLVLDFQGLFRSGFFTFITRAPTRVGFANAREGSTLAYTHRIDVGPGEQHAMERYLKLVAAVGCDTAGPLRYIFPTTDADRAGVAELIGRREPYAVLLPGTNWLTKRWPIEKLAGCVGPLRQEFGLRSIVAGGPDDAALAQQIPDSLNLAGKTSLRQLVALLEGAALVIGNDSGPTHIAAALGRPLVMPYGPTNPVRTGPYQREDSVIRLDIVCSPCYSRNCLHQSCLQWLEVEPVLAVARAQIALSAGSQK